MIFFIFENMRERKMYYIGVREGKKEKEGKIHLSLFSVPHYTWPLSMCIQNLKTVALTEAKKFAWR